MQIKTPPAPFSIKPLPAIIFGVGSIAELVTLTEKIGSTFLFITGVKFSDRCAQWSQIERGMESRNTLIHAVRIGNEPTPEDIDSITAAYGDKNIDGVIAIGGGSVVDAGKAVSAMLPGREQIEQFLEGVGSRRPDGSKIPFIAVPTTAGTGSEASANAVITKHGVNGYKKSLRHDRYIPDFAVIDPELMHTCPPALTASCAMDCFTQLVEGFLSTKASSFTDAIGWSGLEAVERSLVRVYESGEDLQARSDLAYAALCSGIVLANAGLGVIHGLAPIVGSSLSMPHGSVCGTLMAAGNDITYLSLLQHLSDNPDSVPAISKYHRLGRLFCPGNNPDEEMGFRFVEELYRITELFKLPKLSEFGATTAQLDQLADGAAMKNNPAELSKDEVITLLQKRL